MFNTRTTHFDQLFVLLLIIHVLSFKHGRCKRLSLFLLSCDKLKQTGLNTYIHTVSRKEIFSQFFSCLRWLNNHKFQALFFGIFTLTYPCMHNMHYKLHLCTYAWRNSHDERHENSVLFRKYHIFLIKHRLSNKHRASKLEYCCKHWSPFIQGIISSRYYGKIYGCLW